jgi:hypothetical protein
MPMTEMRRGLGDLVLHRIPFLFLANEEDDDLGEAEENAGRNRDPRVNGRIVPGVRENAAKGVHRETADRDENRHQGGDAVPFLFIRRERREH